jgi:sensor domain CHASE-containing protein
MLAAVLTWFAGSGASLLLGFVGGVIKDLVADARNRQALEDKARAETQRDQAQATSTALEASLKAAVDAPKNIPDAIKALREGRE